MAAEILGKRLERPGRIVTGSDGLVFVRTPCEDGDDEHIRKGAINKKGGNTASLERRTTSMEDPRLGELIPAFIRAEQCRISAPLDQGKPRFDIDSSYPQNSLLESTPTRDEDRASDVLENLRIKPSGIAKTPSLTFIDRSSSSDLKTNGTDHLSAGARAREHLRDSVPEPCLSIASTYEVVSLQSALLRIFSQSPRLPSSVLAASTGVSRNSTPSALQDDRSDCTGNQASKLQPRLMDALVAHKGKQRVVSQNPVNTIPEPKMSSRTHWKAAPLPIFCTHAAGLGSPRTLSLQHSLSSFHTTTRQQSSSSTQTASTAPRSVPSSTNPPLSLLPGQQHRIQKPTTSRPITLAPPRPPTAPFLPAAQPGLRPSSQPLATLKMDPKYKALSRKWTSLIVALPIALFTSWVLYERCELNYHSPSLPVLRR